MRLLCVIPSYWPAFRLGGTVFSTHYLNKVLVRKGIDIIVYTTNVGIDGNLEINKKSENNIDGVKVRYFSYVKFFEFLGPTGWQFSYSLTTTLKKEIVAFDLIYIIGIWNYPVFIASYYSKAYNKPYIVSPCGVLYPDVVKKKFWKKWPYYYLIGKWMLSGASAIHYSTEDERQKCHTFLGLKNKYFVVPHGIDLSKFDGNVIMNKENFFCRFPILRNKNIILFLGRINWKKGIDMLLYAFARIRKENTSLYLLIAGEDDRDGYTLKIKDLVKKLKIYDSVLFAGLVDGEDKIAAFKLSKFFVLPSYSENFGMAIIEAMACGCPVVVSDRVGIAEEIKRNNAGIIIETNVESVYQGIKKMLLDENLRKQCSENGRRMVKKYYDINIVADRTIEMYKEVLKNV